MSPFVLELSFKHRRRVVSPPHIHYPANAEAVQAFQKRTDSPQPLTDSFNDIINKWWVAFAIFGTASAILLVVAGISLARWCTRRWKSKKEPPNGETKRSQNMKEKVAIKSLKPIIVHLGIRPEPLAPGLDVNLSSPPNIFITPATASPSKTKFPHRASIDPDLTLDTDEYGYRKSSDSYGESDFDASEADVAQAHIGQLQTHSHNNTHHLSLYHDQEFTHDYPDPREDEQLDEIDLQGPGELDERRYSSGSRTSPTQRDGLPVQSLVNRIAAFAAKRSAQSSPAPPTPLPPQETFGSDSNHETFSSGGSSEVELTDGELGTLALQFPPPSYLSISKSKIPNFAREGVNVDSSPRLQRESDEDLLLKHSVPHFAFHRLSRHVANTSSPDRASTSYIGFVPRTTDQRPQSWSPPTSPVDSRQPCGLTRMSSHQNFQKDENNPYTSFPRSSTTNDGNPRLNLSSQTRARVHARTQAESRSGSATPMSRSGTVSDRYSTRQLAMGSAMQPRRPDVGHGTEDDKEKEMHHFA